MTSGKKKTLRFLATDQVHCIVMERLINKKLLFSISHRAKELGTLMGSR